MTTGSLQPMLRTLRSYILKAEYAFTRSLVTDALAGAGLFLAFITWNTNTPIRFVLTILCFALAFNISPRKPQGADWLLFAFPLLYLIGAFTGPALFQTSFDDATYLAVWFAIVLLPAFTRLTYRTITIFALLMFLQAGALFLNLSQLHDFPRYAGLAESPNPAAGGLVLMAAWAFGAPGTTLLAAPAVASILFTGSRWATVILAGLIGYVLLRRFPPWITIVFAGALFGIVILTYWDSMIAAYSRGEGVLVDAGQDITRRTDFEYRFPMALIPAGFIGTDGAHGTHTTLIRMAIEQSIAATLIYLYLSWRIWKAGSKQTRLMLAVMLALGLMDFYVWQPFTLTAVWFALYGISSVKWVRRTSTEAPL